MRRASLAIVAVALAFGAVPAHANDPYCVLAGAEMGDDGTIGLSCTLEAADAPAHGYLAATPNNFRVFLDVNGDGVFDAEAGDEMIAEVSPTDMDPIVGVLPLEAGKTYTVHLMNGCAEVCGHIGALIVG